MSNKKLYEDAKAVHSDTVNVSETLKTVDKALSEVNPADLITTEEDAYEVMKEIVDAIPANARCLYPEDDMQAALLYAAVYYTAL